MTRGLPVFFRIVDELLPFAWMLRGEELPVLAAYLRPSQGLSRENLERLRNIGVVARQLGPRWLIYADWNLTPALLRESGWLEEIDAVIVSPQDTETTSRKGSGALYDYVVCSRETLPMISSLTTLPARWQAHKALRLVTQATPVQLEGPRLAVPQPLPPIPGIPAAVNYLSKSHRSSLRA